MPQLCAVTRTTLNHTDTDMRKVVTLLDSSDNEPHNKGRSTGKEQINPSPTNIKTQCETHDNYVQENPPETKIASKAAIKHVKKNPPDMIHRKST